MMIGRLTSSENGIIEVLLFLSPVCVNELLGVRLGLLHAVTTSCVEEQMKCQRQLSMS